MVELCFTRLRNKSEQTIQTHTKTNCRQLWTQEMHASNDKWRQATRPFQSFQKPGLHDLGSLVIAQQDHIDSYWFILTTFYQGIPSMQRTSFDVNSIAVGNLPAASCSIRAKHRSLTLEALLRQTEAPVVPKMRLDVPRKNSKISKQICQDNPRRDSHSLVHVKSC